MSPEEGLRAPVDVLAEKVTPREAVEFELRVRDLGPDRLELVALVKGRAPLTLGTHRTIDDAMGAAKRWKDRAERSSYEGRGR